MRVISGSAKGLKLKSPEGLNIRPTADRIKESLFNIIAPYLYNSIFLDLFSGTGSIGIEALSRGAKNVTFVDYDKNSISIIKKNISLAKFEKQSIIYNLNTINAIDKLNKDNKKFDIIFLDPPYNKGFLLPTLEKIEQYNLLNNNGFIICEQHIDEPEINLKNLYTYKIKKYKITKIDFLKYKEVIF